MAEALVILVSLATVVGVSFLVLFSLLARREHRLRTTKRRASAVANGRPAHRHSFQRDDSPL
jgi:hypothetical protein